MKTNSIINGLAACLVALSLTACDKAKENMGDAKDAVTKTAESAKDATGKAMDTMKDTATAAMTNAVASAMGPAGEAIAAAKKALDEKNYQGVLDALKGLGDTKLSPEQQSVVDGLKEAATKMMTGAAAGAADAAKAVLPK